jgi:hypothetical protein
MLTKKTLFAGRGKIWQRQDLAEARSPRGLAWRVAKGQQQTIGVIPTHFVCSATELLARMARHHHHAFVVIECCSDHDGGTAEISEN